MSKLSNYQLLEMFKRLLADGLIRFAMQVQEEIYMRMEEPEYAKIIVH